MEAMGLIAIIVNCYLIGQCGQLQRLFPWLSPEMAIISIVILEVPQAGVVRIEFYIFQNKGFLGLDQKICHHVGQCAQFLDKPLDQIVLMWRR